MSAAPFDFYWLGRAAYAPTWELQEWLRAQVLAGGREAVLLCEHEPVLTLGRSTRPEDLLVPESVLTAHDVACIRTSRGGRATYHGPGQLVVYPVVRLRHGVLRHVEWLAAAAVAVAAVHGITAAFSREVVGVFVGEEKLAAIGVQVSRRVAIHGLALNVTRESTAPFRTGWFRPCGVAVPRVTSLEEQAPLPAQSPDGAVRAAAEHMAAALARLAGHSDFSVTEMTPALLSQARLVE